MVAISRNFRTRTQINFCKVNLTLIATYDTTNESVASKGNGAFLLFALVAIFVFVYNTLPKLCIDKI